MFRERIGRFRAYTNYLLHRDKSSLIGSELVEMRYLWDKEINLNDDKLTGILGHKPNQTPLGEALIESGLLGNSHLATSNSSLAAQ